MASSSLDAILGRALRDQGFRQRVLTDPAGVGREYNLSRDDQTMLEHVNKAEADKFFDNISAGATARYCTSKSCYESG
jgi:hypothetical protein